MVADCFFCRHHRMNPKLCIGQIDYLNVWPLFHCLKKCSPDLDVQYVRGHPSELNRALRTGDVQLSPSSSFEYLLNWSEYQLLPGIGVSGRHEVQSVLLVSPVSLWELPEFLRSHGNIVLLTEASAASVALLKVLWRFAWNLPEPQWNSVGPGLGIKGEHPFLEIGDFALKLRITPPKGWVLIDLATSWERFTGLPFVFAVWILRRDLSPLQQQDLASFVHVLHSCKGYVRSHLEELSEADGLPGWIPRDRLLSYWKTMDYELHPDHMASLILFSHYCRLLGLIPSIPGLSWFSERE